MRGSSNHLRAFVSTLERQTGEIYQPQYLDQDTYNDILNSPNQNGQGQGNGNSRGQSHGNGRGPNR